MIRWRSLAVLLLISLIIPAVTHAKLFRNSYVSFEIPDRWDCKLTDTEWVCRNTDTLQDKHKEAVIILTAKEVGATDNLASYEQHLRTARQLPSASGAAINSQVIKVEIRKINGQDWVDGMHLNSEVRDYYSRYLATVKDRIAILVTFSAHKDHYTTYTNDFFRAVESLRVLNPAGFGRGSSAGGGGLMGGAGPDGQGGGLNIPVDDLPPEGDRHAGKGSSALMLILVLLAAIAAYAVMKSRKKKR